MRYGNLAPKYVFTSVNYEHFLALFNKKEQISCVIPSLVHSTSLLPSSSEIVQKAERRVA